MLKFREIVLLILCGAVIALLVTVYTLSSKIRYEREQCVLKLDDVQSKLIKETKMYSDSTALYKVKYDSLTKKSKVVPIDTAKFVARIKSWRESFLSVSKDTGILNDSIGVLDSLVNVMRNELLQGQHVAVKDSYQFQNPRYRDFGYLMLVGVDVNLLYPEQSLFNWAPQPKLYSALDDAIRWRNRKSYQKYFGYFGGLGYSSNKNFGVLGGARAGNWAVSILGAKESWLLISRGF